MVIWGPDVGAGEKKNKAQVEVEQPLLDNIQDRDQITYIDIMFVNGNPFLIAVVKALEYIITELILHYGLV